MSRDVRRFFAAENGASLVEYSLAVVLIGLVAVVVTSFVGQGTSDAFDEIGNAFPDPVPSVTAVDPAVAVGFVDLLDLVVEIKGLGNSLTSKTQAAEAKYLAGDAGGAIHDLDSLIALVDAQEGKKITPAEAAAIRNTAQDLVEAIEAG
jgi:Flp pilus assembly pilin Flp